MFSAFVLMVPMIYLSGLIFPIENMPDGFQLASYIIPVRYYANILRGVFLRGSGLAVLWPDARVEIEALLVKRDDPNTRNWLIGETVDDLARENAERGVM